MACRIDSETIGDSERRKLCKEGWLPVAPRARGHGFRPHLWQRRGDADGLRRSFRQPTLRRLQDAIDSLRKRLGGVFGNGFRENDLTRGPARGLRLVRIDQPVLREKGHLVDSAEMLLCRLRYGFHVQDDLTAVALRRGGP